MKRQIVHIDAERCNGCGACAAACHEGAIGMVDGKAMLLRDDYCDGMGDCLPACPTGAITFEEREAAAYDEGAVQAHKLKRAAEAGVSAPVGCPGAAVFTIASETVPAAGIEPIGRLGNWPVQLKLAPTRAPYFNGASLLIAADCTAYAYAAFHERFIKGRVTLIGCPKLDGTDYSGKLTEILRGNDIRSIEIVRMTVPCCGGIVYYAETALRNSGKDIPYHITVIGTDGRIADD